MSPTKQVLISPVEDAADQLEERRRQIFEHQIGYEPTPVKHERTSVLMLHWQPADDDLNVADEVSKTTPTKTRTDST